MPPASKLPSDGREVPLLSGRPIAQIGVLVPDLEQALDGHATLSPRERWFVIEPSGIPRPGVHRYRGQPATFVARLAFSPSTPELELIEPVSGESIYAEWIAEHGYGLHHLAVIVESVEAAIREMSVAGFECIQSAIGYGPSGDAGHAYFDTVAELGYVLEAIEHPRH